MKPGRQSKPCVLVIDDDEAIRRVVEATLEAGGYDVVAVGESPEAVATATIQRFDLVLTDMIMPTMDGLEVMKQLRNSQPATPVVVMSGGGLMAPGKYLEMARDFGAKAILEKPFSADQLLMTVGLLT